MTKAKEARNALIIASMKKHLRDGIAASEASGRVHAQLRRSYAMTPDAVLLVWKRYRRASKESHGNSRLSAEQKERLLLILEVFALHNCALTPHKAVALVHSAFQMRISARTITRFVQRHPLRLKLCKSVFLTPGRAAKESLWRVKHFCDVWERFFAEHHLPRHCIFNYDETTMYYNVENQLVIESARRARPNSIGIKAKSLCTCLVIVDAAGQPFLVAICLKKSGNHVQVPIPPDRYPIPTYYYYSPTGYFNQMLFANVMERFCERWQAQHPGLNAVLIGDNCGIHKCIDVMEKCLQQLVYMMFFPPNTSHFLQPLDDTIFASLKNSLHSKIKDISWEAAVFGSASGDLLYGAMFDAIRDTLMKPEVLKGAWERTGLVPYNRQKILSGASVNLGTLYDHRDDHAHTVADATIAAVAKDVGTFIDDARERLGTARKRSSSQRVAVDDTHGFLSPGLISARRAQVRKTSSNAAVHEQPDELGSGDEAETAGTGPAGPAPTNKGQCPVTTCMAGSTRGCRLFGCNVCDWECCFHHKSHKHHLESN